MLVMRFLGVVSIWGFPNEVHTILFPMRDCNRVELLIASDCVEPNDWMSIDDLASFPCFFAEACWYLSVLKWRKFPVTAVSFFFRPSKDFLAPWLRMTRWTDLSFTVLGSWKVIKRNLPLPSSVSAFSPRGKSCVLGLVLGQSSWTIFQVTPAPCQAISVACFQIPGNFDRKWAVVGSWEGKYWLIGKNFCYRVTFKDAFTRTKVRPERRRERHAILRRL